MPLHVYYIYISAPKVGLLILISVYIYIYSTRHIPDLGGINIRSPSENTNSFYVNDYAFFSRVRVVQFR